MVIESDIRDRFLTCIDELKATHTVKEIAQQIGTHASYIAQVRTAPRPAVPSILIARLCLQYGFSPAYILLGQGEMKAPIPDSKEEKWEKERERYLDLISKLMEGLLEVKAEFNDPLSQLVNEAGKKGRKQ